MAERIANSESIEQKQATVDEWIRGISERQEVGEMKLKILREVLESYGAHFENLNEKGKESLRGYSEKDRGPGVRQVWGNDFVDSYKEWAEGSLEDCESKTGVQWPMLENKEHPEKSTHRKVSGVNQFLFELTAFASGETSFEDYKRYMEARVKNGVAWVEGRKEERIKIKLPMDEKPKLVSSIPKEFPIAAMDWIKKRANEFPLQQ